MTSFFKQIAVAFAIVAAVPLVKAETFAKVPAGVSVQVRIVERLNSETAAVGQKFHGNLAAPIVAHGRTLFPKGAPVTGEVVNVERSGRLSNPGELHLRLRTITSRGRTYALDLPPVVIKGESHAKSNVTKIGGTTAFGAIIGALAGGGKGAAIGAGVGAAAGTTAAAATGKKAAVVPSEAVLVWVAQGAPEPVSPPAQVAAPVQQSQAQPNYYPEEDQRQVMSGDRRDEDRDEPRNEARDEQREDNRYEERPEDRYANGDYAPGGPEGFSTYDRQVISQCFVDRRAGLPPGLAKRDHLPPGLERHLQRNGTLPPGLQRRVQPLPDRCEARLPQLPRDWSRVVLSGRIMLLGPGYRIVDILWVGSD
jgi:hypothetical protein